MSFFGNQGFQAQNNGSRIFPVQANTGSTDSYGNYLPAITPGAILKRTLGTSFVVAAGAGTPVVGTDYIIGIASSNSTETATNNGLIEVTPLKDGEIFRFQADASLLTGTTSIVAIAGTTTQTQAQLNYNALIGKRVLFGTTSVGGVTRLTVLGTDSANNGLVVEYTSTVANAGTVAVSLRTGAKYTA